MISDRKKNNRSNNRKTTANDIIGNQMISHAPAIQSKAYQRNSNTKPIKRIYDGDRVLVHGDVSKAFRMLQKKQGLYGTRAALRFRKDHPAPGERKRAKRRAARVKCLRSK